jgi:hypothetical protein
LRVRTDGGRCLVGRDDGDGHGLVRVRVMDGYANDDVVTTSDDHDDATAMTR